MTKKNIHEDVLKNNKAMSVDVDTFATLLNDQLSLHHEVLRKGDFVVDDVMSFQRKIIVEAILDKLSWLMSGERGTEGYVDKTKARIAEAQRRFRGDEISTVYLQGAIAEHKAAIAKHQALEDIFEDLQESYRAEHDERYVPYGTSRWANVRRDTRSDVPADIKAELEALGMTPEIGGVANTDGVDTTSDVA